MAPARTRKHDTSISSNDDIPAFPAPPTMFALTTHTPKQSPAKSMASITQVQKQALIDNLQLEITERARKLRAQYALQAQGLKTRLEMRVNRIPQALRKRNIHDLVEEHAAKAKPGPAPPLMPAAREADPAQPAKQSVAQKKQLGKRKSDDISTGDDKENVVSNDADDLANPKKRTKTNIAIANSKATRTGSRKVGPAGVLSPKSHNSRTYPQSPLKPSTLSPEKVQPARPMISSQSAATKPVTRAPSRQTKRNRPAADVDGRTSEASNSSAGTTIITKPGTKKGPGATRKGAQPKTATTGRKPAAAKQEAAPAVGGGRTLRKRN
ncbi:Hypothetical predicted protein [Lecanosticta acicola]|uniref:Borealin N-terminal domain-containing protein n=1 Tax=Lecanosticta acicola TaxID=111012 RepID=A0AAI8YUI8_9PEZI|nr:Hypothetical predicted protein [Lecanosticta acicola]